MKKEYIGTIKLLNGIKVDISIDANQEYGIEWEKNGKLLETGLHAYSYNNKFINDIIYLLDRETYLNGKYTKEYINYLYNSILKGIDYGNY